jgi:hypothetical protein
MCRHDALWVSSNTSNMCSTAAGRVSGVTGLSAFVVAPPSGVRVRSRFRPTEFEVAVLRRVGEQLHGLYAQDVNDRITVGQSPRKTMNVPGGRKH